MIYLDSASAAFLHPKAKEKMDEAWEIWANPSANHQLGKKNKTLLENLRKDFIEIYNVPKNASVIFTSCATESNNLILNSVILPKVKLLSHPSVICKEVFFTDLEDILSNQPHLVSIPLIQHETGLIFPVDKIASLVKKYNSKLHIDASQAKVVDFQKLNCDYLTISSHKIGGPIGIAAVISKTLLTPMINGGGQEMNMRSGTQAVPLIAGFVAAAKELQYQLSHFEKLKKVMKQKIKAEFFLEHYLDYKFVDHINCLLTQQPGSEIVAYMDLNNVAISNGSACSSGTMEGIRCLRYFNLVPENATRISFGWNTILTEVEKFCELFNKFVDNNAA